MRTAPLPAGYADRDGTHPPDWHGLVVWDILFNALTTGLFMVASVAELARPDLFAPVGTWAYPFALGFLLLDLLLLVLDLGDPLRFHHMLRVFKVTSPMSLGTWCLAAYSLPLTLLVALDLVGYTGWLRPALLVVGLPFAFGSAAYKGVLFSTTAQPGWRDARWLGAYHTSGAVVFGAVGLFALATWTSHDRAATALRPVVALLPVLHLVPLVLLARELRPALRGRMTRGDWVKEGLATGAAALIPIDAAIAGVGPVSTGLALAVVLAGGWLVRRRVVLLPHSHERSSGRE